MTYKQLLTIPTLIAALAVGVAVSSATAAEGPGELHGHGLLPTALVVDSSGPGSGSGLEKRIRIDNGLVEREIRIKNDGLEREIRIKSDDLLGGREIRIRVEAEHGLVPMTTPLSTEKVVKLIKKALEM